MIKEYENKDIKNKICLKCGINLIEYIDIKQTYLEI